MERLSTDWLVSIVIGASTYSTVPPQDFAVHNFVVVYFVRYFVHSISVSVGYVLETYIFLLYYIPLCCFSIERLQSTHAVDQFFRNNKRS